MLKKFPSADAIVKKESDLGEKGRGGGEDGWEEEGRDREFVRSRGPAFLPLASWEEEARER